MKGWYGEKQKHALASKGIKSVEYYNKNQDLVFFDFWKASIESNFSDFDFDVAYEFFKPDIEGKLAQFGQYGFDRWYNEMSECSIDYMVEVLEDDGEDVSDWWESEEKENIFKEIIHDRFYLKDVEQADVRGFVTEWNKLLDEINKPHKSLKENIILLDRIIHMEHEMGDVYDLDNLRSNFDNWYTGVRRFR